MSNTQLSTNTAPGKLTNHFKIGIVGLPNIGKSSLFNILSNSEVPTDESPFCTVGEIST